jgi:hypothetical protein
MKRPTREEAKAAIDWGWCALHLGPVQKEHRIAEHENYGEDGFSCENPNHECVLVCAATASIVTSGYKTG